MNVQCDKNTLLTFVIMLLATIDTLYAVYKGKRTIATAIFVIVAMTIAFFRLGTDILKLIPFEMFVVIEVILLILCMVIKLKNKFRNDFIMMRLPYVLSRVIDVKESFVTADLIELFQVSFDSKDQTKESTTDEAA